MFRLFAIFACCMFTGCQNFESYQGSNPSVSTTCTGAAHLSWTAPTTNTDGSALTDLAGFNIYYGPNPAQLATKISVQGATTTKYVLPAIAIGTYYFALTALNTAGQESTPTQPVSANIVCGGVTSVVGL